MPILKDSFIHGPAVPNQRRLTAKEKQALRGIADEQGWQAARVAADLGIQNDSVVSTAPTGGTLPNNRSFTAFRVVGHRQVLDNNRLVVKVAYPVNLGSPHPADIVAFVTSKFPGMEIEYTNDRKSGLIEMILTAASESPCSKCSVLEKEGCNCDKTAQMDAGNLPAGTAQDPIDGQRDALSAPEIEGTGKIGQMAPPPAPGPAADNMPPAPPEVPSMNGPGELPPEQDDPGSEVSLDEALEMLQEATDVVVNKVQEGDAIIHGQEVESVEEAPAQGTPPVGTPAAAGAPISATAQKDDDDPDKIMDRAIEQAGTPRRPDRPQQGVGNSFVNMDKLLKAKELAKKRVQDTQNKELGIQTPSSSPSNIGSDPSDAKKAPLGGVPHYEYGSPEDQEYMWLDELADTRVNTTWSPGERDEASGKLVMPDDIDAGMRNNVARPYGHMEEGDKRKFQGIPFMSAQKGKFEKDNTLVSVLPPDVYKKVFDPSGVATARKMWHAIMPKIPGKTWTRAEAEKEWQAMSPAQRDKLIAEATARGALRNSKWQWQLLTPAEREQARFDMMYANKAVRDRIRKLMQHKPDGPVSPGGKSPTGDTPPENKPTAVPPTKRKGQIEETAVDDAAVEYWEQLLGEYGHQMTKDCCPEHKDLLDQRTTDMRAIAAELGITVTDEQVEKVALSLRRPRAIGYFMEFARKGFAAPPMDRMVDMALELSQSDANLARQLDRLTLKYLMKTSDLMNAMTPDAQRNVLLRAVRGDKRIYNSMLRLYNQVVGVNGPVSPDKAPMAVEAALRITAKGFEVKVRKQPSDEIKPSQTSDRADNKTNTQVIPGHVNFSCDGVRQKGVYTYMDIAWEPKETEGRSEKGIHQLLISYVKGLESHKEFIDFGFIGTPHLQEVDIEAGFATAYFRASKGGDAVLAVEDE